MDYSLSMAIRRIIRLIINLEFTDRKLEPEKHQERMISTLKFLGIASLIFITMFCIFYLIAIVWGIKKN